MRPCNCNKEWYEKHGFGTYHDTTQMMPFWRNNAVTVDTCLVDEILSLWDDKIVTTGSCCGHNIVKGFISVTPEDESKMRTLGYQRYPHPDAAVNDHFYPKTIEAENETN